jgi:hypothetical protein
MRDWQKKLPESQKGLIQEIVDQIPTTMGLRDTVEDILDNLATTGGGAGTAPKFKYLIVTDGDVQGTNDQEKADEYAASDDNYVLLVPDCKWVVEPGMEDDITEMK